jgi:hypothetical protein
MYAAYLSLTVYLYPWRGAHGSERTETKTETEHQSSHICTHTRYQYIPVHNLTLSPGQSRYTASPEIALSPARSRRDVTPGAGRLDGLAQLFPSLAQGDGIRPAL